MDPALKAIEKDIRTAFEVDNALSPVFKQRYRCPLGKHVKPSLEELQNEILNNGNRFVVTPDVYKIWIDVTHEWLPKLHISTHKIVWFRCSGMGWNRVSRELVKERLTSTYFHRNTLYRYFIKGLQEINDHFHPYNH